MSSLLDRVCFPQLLARAENPRCIGVKCTEWEMCRIRLLESESMLQEWIENPEKMTKMVVKMYRVGYRFGGRKI